MAWTRPILTYFTDWLFLADDLRWRKSNHYLIRSFIFTFDDDFWTVYPSICFFNGLFTVPVYLGNILPILTLGALLGSIYGTILVHTFGMDPIYIKDFIVIAMAGYFAAIGKAPLTAVILVTEMVGSLNHLMPLGLVALVAYIINDLLGGNPIYESLLRTIACS